MSVLRIARVLVPFLQLTFAPVGPRGPVAGQSAPPSQPIRRSPVRFTDTLATLSAAGGSTCVTTTAGAAWCWGPFDRRGGTPSRIVGPTGAPLRLRSLATSDYVRCGLTFDREVWCNAGATGGYRDSTGNAEPVPPACRSLRCLAPLPMPGALPNAPLRGVVAGFMHACALTPVGSAYCWGNNRMGTLGNGTWAADSTGFGGEIVRAPTAVVGSLRFSQLSSTAEVTCGLTVPAGDAYCWGYGQNGETGDSSVMTYCDGPKPYFTRSCSTPTPARVVPESLPGDRVRPSDVKFTSVAAGFRVACAVSEQAEAYCWGSNYRCELGRCGSGESARAHRIGVPGRVVEVAAGYWHACARTLDRRIFCWGTNTAGQLGSLATVNATADGGPPDYRDSTRRDVYSAAYRDPCFMGGRCSPVPVEVASPHRWLALALGTDHACALAEDDGGIYCWGGTERSTLGSAARLVRCENRSFQWPDVQCQPTPVRVPGLPALAAPPETTTAVRDQARVTVSRQELRVEFPPDSAGLWGWSDSIDRRYVAQYAWNVMIESMDGPRLLVLQVVRRDDRAREFRSLDSLVASGRPALCTSGWGGSCRSDRIAAFVVDARVVLTLRDSAQIARLFGLRQPAVAVWRVRPDRPHRYTGDTIRVEYIAPEIPRPTQATRAEADSGHRAFERSISSIGRSLGGGSQRSDTLWLPLGDSAWLSIAEARCRYDVCSVGQFAERASWQIGDTTIVGAGTVDRGMSGGYPSRELMLLVIPRRTGRTSVRADLPPTATDTMPSRTPPARTLVRTVVVTNRVGRVELAEPADTIHAGETGILRARAFDTSGRRIDGAPITVRLLPNSGGSPLDAHGQVRVYFERPGPATLVATFGGVADTLAVTVAPSRKK